MNTVNFQLVLRTIKWYISQYKSSQPISVTLRFLVPLGLGDQCLSLCLFPRYPFLLPLYP